MNLILLLVVMAEACLGLCCWLSPETLRWAAAHLLCRADVIEAARREHSRRLQYWQLELGVDQAVSENMTPVITVVQSAVRR
jgi:hypothetical protein